MRQSEKYPWVIQLRNPRLYLQEPVVIDAELRAQLDAFANRDPERPWAWFVQATRMITKHDFEMVTRS